MQLDRTLHPKIKLIDKVSITSPQIEYYDNGTSLHCFNMGDQDVSRIDFMIEAGKWDQPKNLISTFTNLLLKEGAGRLSSKSIAEQLDYYGAWLQLSETHHYSYITLYTPNRFFYETLDILELMVKDPLFPEQELKTNLERRKQEFLINKEKVQSLALESFLSSLFGTEHPYGRSAIETDFNQISTDDLKSFYSNFYSSQNTKIILSGKVSDKMQQAVKAKFGLENWGHIRSEIERKTFTLNLGIEKNIFVEKQRALQNGIRMGLHTISRLHPDFNRFRIMNMILGGYFGSRLMSNIREEKGYTYGISSGITSFRHNTYLTIATQAACPFTDLLITEVYNEINRLQQELVGKEELNLVKNYMMGDFVRSLDGVFSLADIYISQLVGNLTTDYYYKQVEAIQQITSKEIRDMAQKYLLKDEIYCIVAGCRDSQ